MSELENKFLQSEHESRGRGDRGERGGCAANNEHKAQRSVDSIDLEEKLTYNKDDDTFKKFDILHISRTTTDYNYLYYQLFISQTTLHNSYPPPSISSRHKSDCLTEPILEMGSHLKFWKHESVFIKLCYSCPRIVPPNDPGDSVSCVWLTSRLVNNSISQTTVNTNTLLYTPLLEGRELLYFEWHFAGIDYHIYTLYIIYTLCEGCAIFYKSNKKSITARNLLSQLEILSLLCVYKFCWWQINRISIKRLSISLSTSVTPFFFIEFVTRLFWLENKKIYLWIVPI